MAEPSQPGQGVAPDISGDLQVAPLFQDDGLVREWSMLPPELLEIIGGHVEEGAQLSAASLVCKSWRQSIPSGLSCLDLDMHSDPDRWRNKLAYLQEMLARLSSCTIHINTNVSGALLCQNIALLQQLRGIQSLRLELREGCELPPAAAHAVGAMTHLSSLAIIGGILVPDAVHALLHGISSSPSLTSLTLLPAPRNGLGDFEMPLLAAATAPLQVLQFRAVRLTSAGLQVLSRGLPHIRRLSICSMDADSGYELSCLERLDSLEQLHLALDHWQAPPAATQAAAPPSAPSAMHAAAGAFAPQGVQQAVRHAGTAVGGGVSRTGSTAAAVAYAQWGSLLPQQTSATAAAAAAFRRSAGGPAGQHACIPRPGRSLGLQFKWTERTQGLLRSATDPSSLSGLTNLDLGACRVSNEAVFEAVAALTGLRELRMCVYSNADHTVECQLSRLGQLAGLQTFHLAKQHAYFPEARRFMESSIAVPLTPSAMHSLASNWSQLSSLHLTLSRTDYSAEGLALLQQFTGLKELALGVATGSSNGKGSVENLAGLTGNGEGGTGSAGMMPSCAAGAPRVALTWLPGGLTKLELSCLALDLALPGSGAENEKSQGGSGGSSGAAPKDQGGSGDAGAETYVRHAAAGAEGLVPRPSLLPPAPLPLSFLEVLCMDRCTCTPCGPMLGPLLQRVAPRLKLLRLTGVDGLGNDDLVRLAGASRLSSLTVSAPRNEAVSQSALAALSGLRGLKHLAWESDDITAHGPCLDTLQAFSTLRYLWLSCTEHTLSNGCGRAALTQALPYCHVELPGGGMEQA